MKHHALKLAFVALTIPLISNIALAEPEVCKPNDFCINLKLVNIGQPNVMAAVHWEATIMGQTFKRDTINSRTDNSETQVLNFGDDVRVFNITNFKYLVKTVNDKNIDTPCLISHPLINKGTVDKIEITGFAGKYICKITQ